jgi:hypothetical protein
LRRTGRIWRALIDLAGLALLMTSVLGLMIYFSMRLRTALVLVARGATLMADAVMLIMN